MIRYLSHEISALNPTYGSCARTIELKQLRSLAQGESSCSFWFGMENHLGTHVDCPAHFFSNGMKIADYPADFWFFCKPQILPVKAEPGEIISQKSLPFEINPDTDLLIFNSGWSKKRREEEYCLRNPGIDPALGIWLRKAFPKIKAIGIDWISLSSFAHRDIGRDAHKAFLDPDGAGHPILIIEDMFMPGTVKELCQAWAFPLRIAGIDSAPCTVVGVFND